MRVRIRFHDDLKAVSEIVGGMLLVLIAIVAFVAIYNYVLPLRLPPSEPNVKLMGYVTTDASGGPVLVLEHMGGEQLYSYKVLVDQSDGLHTYEYENQPWKIGDCYNPPFDPVLFNEEKVVRITVVDIREDGSEQIIFQGDLTPESKPQGSEPPQEPVLPSDPTLVSTLRTDTGDEDLICFNYSVNTTIDPLTYIYNWMTKTGEVSTPLACLLMPFDTNNAMISKDYSGNNFNGSVSDAMWTNQGKIGGAYSFNGDDSILLPYCFDDSFINQLTVEAWVKTSQSSGSILSYDRNKYWELAVANGRVKWSTNALDSVTDSCGNDTVSNNQWHYVAATYDSSTGDSDIYVDGQLDATTQAHLSGLPLGLGDTPAGAIGRGNGSVSRQTIFSTSFESSEEKTQWQAHNGTGGQQEAWSTLRYDDFNTGWGSYTDGDGGGSDCYRSSAYKHEGSYGACVRDNSGTYSSFYLTNSIDVASPAYKSLKIDFWWMWNGVGWSAGEDWWVWYYDGDNWNRVLDMNYPSGLSKDVWYHEIIYINETNYYFPTNMKIRFQCDAYDDNDRVYFDQIYINATTWGRIECDFDQLPSTALDPRTGSYSLGGSGDFDPEYVAYNRTAINLANYTSVEVTIWYSYKYTESADFLGLYYLNNTHWTPFFEVPDPDSSSSQIPWMNAHIYLPDSLNTLVLQFKWMTSSTTEYVAIDDLEITGIPQAGEGNFTGIIDEVKIYQRVLSAEQIYQNYLCSKDGHCDRSVIVAEETQADERWLCLVTPNDGTVDDEPTYSNIVYVKGSYSGG